MTPVGAASRLFEFSAEALLGVVNALASGQAGPWILRLKHHLESVYVRRGSIFLAAA